MTRLASDRILVRETAAREKNTPIVVELLPTHLSLRLKGDNHKASYGYKELLCAWNALETEVIRLKSARIRSLRSGRIRANR